jgi:hypothetical protein
MDSYELPFAKINILREDIAEIIINDAVEMNMDMVDEYHEFLLSHLRAPFSLLINKKNKYTYEFEAQKKLATLNEINAMAVVVYNRITEVSTKSLASVPRDVSWNLKIFTDRNEALGWVMASQSNFGQDNTNLDKI